MKRRTTSIGDVVDNYDFNKEEKRLDKARNFLLEEQTHKLRLLEIEHRAVLSRYEKHKARVANISSNLSMEEITQLKFKDKMMQNKLPALKSTLKNEVNPRKILKRSISVPSTFSCHRAAPPCERRRSWSKIRATMLSRNRENMKLLEKRKDELLRRISRTSVSSEENLSSQESPNGDDLLDNIDAVRETLRKNKQERMRKGIDRIGVDEMLMKEDETEEEYEARKRKLNTSLQNCRYLRRKCDGSIEYDMKRITVLACKQRDAPRIWDVSLPHNLL
ncbi:uncharacterized protein LOC117110775 [Anneissia japonica]|uniref:uncharacterized protein LOC117110775 n=1 Tax=Anneissia japonica TaxID=1529436 RepID=UPI001425B017|nr:uncharacterized protein LOC117110775 [Anneissia japonica]